MSFRIVFFLCLLFVTAHSQMSASPTSGSQTGTQSQSVSGSGTGSSSGSASGTHTSSGSGTGSASNSGSATSSHTGSVSGTVSPSQAPAPTNLTNSCRRPDGTNHIYFLCLSWADLTGSLRSFTVTITPSTGSSFTRTTTGSCAAGGCYLFINNLTPATTYTISIVGFDAAGRSSALPLTGSFKTDPLDAKTSNALDLTNVACKPGVSVGYRTTIECSWTLPAIPPTSVRVNGHCRPNPPNFPPQKRKTIPARHYGPPAPSNVTRLAHRYNSKCVMEIAGFYTNHIRYRGRAELFRVNVTLL